MSPTIFFNDRTRIISNSTHVETTLIDALENFTLATDFHRIEFQWNVNFDMFISDFNLNVNRYIYPLFLSV